MDYWRIWFPARLVTVVLALVLGVGWHLFFPRVPELVPILIGGAMLVGLERWLRQQLRHEEVVIAQPHEPREFTLTSVYRLFDAATRVRVSIDNNEIQRWMARHKIAYEPNETGVALYGLAGYRHLLATSHRIIVRPADLMKPPGDVRFGDISALRSTKTGLLLLLPDGDELAIDMYEHEAPPFVAALGELLNCRGPGRLSNPPAALLGSVDHESLEARAPQ